MLENSRASTGIARASTGIARASTGIARASTGIARASPGIARASPGIARDSPGIARASTGIARNVRSAGQARDDHETPPPDPNHPEIPAVPSLPVQTQDPIQRHHPRRNRRLLRAVQGGMEGEGEGMSLYNFPGVKRRIVGMGRAVHSAASPLNLLGPDWNRPDAGRDGSVPRSPDGLVKPGQKQTSQHWPENGGLEPSRTRADADMSASVNLGWPSRGASALKGEKTGGWPMRERARVRVHGRDQTAGYARRSRLESVSGRGFNSPQVHHISETPGRNGAGGVAPKGEKA